MASDNPRLARFACLDCKTRKVKCDRLLPACNRCVKDGETCDYPTMRQRPSQANTAARPRVHELESRLGELEEKLRERDAAVAAATQQQLPHTPESLPESVGCALVGTGRFEQLPPQSLVEELTNIYFATLHCNAPMLHPLRYRASLYRPPHMQPPLCLQYTVMALAASSSATHRSAAEPFYRRARRYLEADEMKDDSCHVTLSHAQCWLLLSHFEAQHLWFSRASMSTSRAVRLAQILGLQSLDGLASVNQTLPPPRDWCEREERRRTFWVGFCTDRGTSSTAGWPVLIDAHRIQTCLPGSEEAFQMGMPEPSVTLKDALSMKGASIISSFAHRVVSTHLFHECFDSNHDGSSQAEMTPMGEQIFWTRFRELDDGITSAFTKLPPGLQCPDNNAYDPDAVLINLQLHTARICLYRAASARERQQGGARPVVHTVSNSLQSAHQVVTIVALVFDIHARFQNPFIGFAVFMAGFALLKHYVVEQDAESYGTLMGLMDVMVAVAGEMESVVTASLAVQLAQEMERTGVDPLAMHKVSGLLEKMDLNGPLLGKEDEGTGSVLLCPLEARFGPSPLPSQQ